MDIFWFLQDVRLQKTHSSSVLFILQVIPSSYILAESPKNWSVGKADFQPHIQVIGYEDA